MKKSTLPELGNLFLALSDKTRLRLLGLMANGEVSVGFLAGQLGESQPKTSRHLAYLRNAGLVSARRDGKRIHYEIQWPEDNSVAAVLSATLESLGLVRLDHHVPSIADIDAVGDRFADEPTNTYEEAYESDYEPNEMEIFLL